MAIERWTDDMLDRFATDTQKNGRELLQALVTLTDAQRQTNNNVDRLVGAVQEISVDIREMQSDIREIQSEIRGLQLENRRIIERVFGTDA